MKFFPKRLTNIPMIVLNHESNDESEFDEKIKNILEEFL